VAAPACPTSPSACSWLPRYEHPQPLDQQDPVAEHPGISAAVNAADTIVFIVAECALAESRCSLVPSAIRAQRPRVVRGPNIRWRVISIPRVKSQLDIPGRTPPRGYRSDPAPRQTLSDGGKIPKQQLVSSTNLRYASSHAEPICANESTRIWFQDV
jgi:hypothetical protein